MNYFEHTNQLPSKLFKVKVPLIATYTEEEMGIFGMPVNVDDGKVNQDSYAMDTVVMFNLNRIIDTYISGYPISLVIPDESKEVFSILEEYLSLHNHNNHQLNYDVVQDDRIMEIDKMLSELFSYNRATIVKDVVSVNNGFTNGFGGVHLGVPNNVNDDSYRIRDDEQLGIMSGYQNTQQGNTTYIQPNQISVDISKIERTPAVKLKAGINATQLSDQYIK